jgi:hypothetical protein
MSDYLERLVAGATRTTRQPSIRPVLGSVYSPPQYSGVQEVFEEREAGAIEHRNEDVVAEARQENVAAETKTSAAAEPSREIHASLDEATRLEVTRPEVVRDHRQSVPFIRKIADFEPLVGEPGIIPAPVRAETEAPLKRIESADPPAETILTYRPLVARTASEVRPFKSSDTFFSGRTRPTKQDSPWRSETASREPDEIQIHIGRIEVVAVPQQQAVRPTAKSSRKSPSLDDYLKRGRRGV